MIQVTEVKEDSIEIWKNICTGKTETHPLGTFDKLFEDVKTYGGDDL